MKRSAMSCFLHCIYFVVLGMLQLCRNAWTLEVQHCPKNSVFQLLIYTIATISRFRQQMFKYRFRNKREIKIYISLYDGLASEYGTF